MIEDKGLWLLFDMTVFLQPICDLPFEYQAFFTNIKGTQHLWIQHKHHFNVRQIMIEMYEVSNKKYC